AGLAGRRAADDPRQPLQDLDPVGAGLWRAGHRRRADRPQRDAGVRGRADRLRAGAVTSMGDRAADLEARVVELETRLAFQDHALAELSDALAELRAEAARNAEALRVGLEELRQSRGSFFADPAQEPPPPHY